MVLAAAPERPAPAGAVLDADVVAAAGIGGAGRDVLAGAGIITNNPNRERAAQDLRSLVTNKDGELWEVIAADAQAELALVCDLITHSLEEGTDPSKIAVLAPHRFKFPGLRTTLETHHIPFVYIGSLNGVSVGTIGEVAVWSMQARKTLSAGEGGFLATRHKSLYERALLAGHYRGRAYTEVTDRAL